MTPTAIETAARRRLNAISSSFWSSAEVIEDCLYFALMELCTRAKVYEVTATTTSVASTQAYAKPTGCIEIKQITYDNQKLEVMAEREYFSLNLTGTTSAIGRPTHYFLWDDQYFLFPTPDTSALTISIRYTSEPGAITSASTLPVPIQFHPRLVNGVAYYMLLKEVDDPRLPIFQARWMQDIQDVVDEWARLKQADKPPRVRVEEVLLTSVTGII